MRSLLHHQVGLQQEQLRKSQKGSHGYGQELPDCNRQRSELCKFCRGSKGRRSPWSMRRCGAFPFRKKDFELSCFQNSFLNVKRTTQSKRKEEEEEEWADSSSYGRPTLLIVLELFFINGKMFSHMAVNMCCKYLLYYIIYVPWVSHWFETKGNRIVAKR